MQERSTNVRNNSFIRDLTDFLVEIGKKIEGFEAIRTERIFQQSFHRTFLYGF